MKKQIVGNQAGIGKEMIANGVLPWWAALVLARNSGASAALNGSRHYHHCTDCGCVMICSDKECKNLKMCCPECSEKIKSSQGGN